MKRAVVVSVVLLCLFSCSAPLTAGDGVIKPPSRKGLECRSAHEKVEVCFEGTKPDFNRTTELVILLEILFPLVEFPKVEIFILPYQKFEKRVIRRWPAFEQGLKLGNGIIFAHTYITPEGAWAIEAYQPMSDDLLIHELLHHILLNSAKFEILHDHTILESVIENVQTSQAYKAWLRERH
jgi:hypothetical protein